MIWIGFDKRPGISICGKFILYAAESIYIMSRCDPLFVCEPLAQRFYERKKAKTNGIIAIRAIARKLARACWMMLKHQQPYEAKLMFPG